MSTEHESTPTSDECFFIAAIGAEGSEQRKRSDGVLDFIVAPAAEVLGLKAERADRIGQPGLITTQVIAHVLEAKAAVVDLTDLNPNVFYELAIRHTARLPTALIAEEGCKLPFDIAQMRTIFFNSKDLASANACKLRIVEHLRQAIESGATDSPVASAVDIQQLLRSGTPVDRTIADLAETTEGLVKSQSSIHEMLDGILEYMHRSSAGMGGASGQAYLDLFEGLGNLRSAIQKCGFADGQVGPRLIVSYQALAEPILHILRNAPIMSLRHTRLQMEELSRPIIFSPGFPGVSVRGPRHPRKRPEEKPEAEALK